ncbi:MAG TPA: hypothetical protein VGX76_20985 [Pirellulales bacterium]|nr:hypothetical protein [Pirellulales bacterium]
MSAQPLTERHAAMQRATDVDEVDRFTAIREESLELIESTRSLVAEMRVILEECKQWRPVVPRPEPTASSEPARLPAKRTTVRRSRVPRGKRGRLAKPK